MQCKRLRACVLLVDFAVVGLLVLGHNSIVV